MRTAFVSAICLLAASLASTGAWARTDTCYMGGPLLPNYTINGNGTLSGTDVLVTPDLTNQLASVIFNPTFSTLGDLHVKMVVQITTTTGSGADGMAFVMHNDPRGIAAIGSPGEGIGYGVQNATNNVAITPSIAVEFDTYYNNGRLDPNHAQDINYGHIGLMFDGNPTHDGVASHIKDLNGTGITLKTGTPISLWIDFTNATNTIDVYIAAGRTAAKPATPAMTANVDLDTLNPTGHTFYMGFTGSTGGQQSKHEVLEFYASDTIADPTTACCSSNADCAASPLGAVCDPQKRTCGQCTSLDVSRCSAPAGCNLVPANNVCVAACDGDYGATGTSHPCSSANFPSCTFSGPGAGTCQACDGDDGSGTTSECAPSTPYCSATGFCGFCRNDSDCTAAGPTHTGAQCNPATGRCVQCLTGADCANPTPVCDAAGACVACTNDLGGAAPACWNPNAPACVAGSCRECSAALTSACPASSPACDTATLACAPCVSDHGGASPACPSAALPRCSSGLCVQCTSGADCSGATPICAGGTCLACDGDFGSGSAHACPTAGAPACAAGACVQCSATNVTQCSGATPACNTTTGTCAACNGDFGSGAARACADGQQPACLASGACAQCRAGTTGVSTTYFVNAITPGVNVGADGTTNMTTLGDRTVTSGSTNQHRAMTNATAPTGTSRERINLGASATLTGQEFFRAYSPVYASPTLIAANATAYADFYMRATGTAVTAWARLYEYSDATGVVGALKGTATFAGNASVTTRQALNGSFGNAAFQVAAGNRLMVVYGFDTTASRPSYLWGQASSATPSGFQSFAVSETGQNALACPSGACTASNTCATPCDGDRGSGTANACTSALLPACVAGACVPCSSTNATACTAANLVCDAVLNQCVQCTEADASKCTGATPICNVATSSCVACNGDVGSTASFSCTSPSAPVCQGGACVPCANDLGGAAPACSMATAPACVSGQCLQCSAGSTSACTGATPVCDTAANQCRPCGGSYGGTASLACTAATTPVCVSGSCEPCAGDFGGPAGSCELATLPACLPTGACVQCSASDLSLCTGATPICDEASNLCVACNGAYASGATHACTDWTRPLCVSGACVQCASGADCANPTPICDATSHACGACNGDDGTAASRACPSSAPTCSATGCKACTANSDCTFAGAAHTGGVCDTATGRCLQCNVDGDCGAAQWCSANLCVAKVANGALIPAPGTCATVGARACLSGVCETSDNRCGYANAPASTGPCTGDDAKCRSGRCDPTDNLCGLTNGQGTCTADAQCRLDLCDLSNSKCGEPRGSACAAGSECSTLQCADTVCCDTACAGHCDSCNLSGSAGTCTLLTDGSAGSPSCTPYLCDGAGADCPATCVTDLDCAAGNWCDATGHCVPKSDNGTLCGGGHECLTDACVDGVCCNNSCAGACDACNLSGSAGTCTANPGSAGDPSCGAYLCGAAATCPTACTLQTHCSTGNWCDGTGHCVAQVDQGQACTADAGCLNGRCVDGYCCSSDCAGQCEACNVLGNLGTCSPFTGAPRNGRPACAGGTSTCAGQCEPTERLSCTYPTTQCVDPSCDAATGTETHAATCDGAGACQVPTTATCSPYLCGATACQSVCATSADCTTGFWCDPTFHCVPQLLVGDACTAADSCPGGRCVDGYCCASACAGQCEACDVSGHLGACWPVTGAPHAGRTACVTANAACAGQCDGSLRTACTYPGASTSCGTPACAAGTATSGACDAAGGCATSSAACTPFVCDAAACKTACAADGECASGFWCDVPGCVAKLANGKGCSGGNECLSGHCVDGLCCDTACAGQCEACDLGPAKGTCTAVVGAPRGARPACGGAGVCAGTCDGRQTLSCAFPDESIECRAASCAADVATLPAGCDGAGACAPVQTVACAPFHCGASQCVGDCAVDSDCAAGAYCAGGLCQPKLADGTPCAADAQCASDHCADGVCCDAACAGQCEACNLSGKTGVCSPTTGAPVGGRTACAGDGSACGGACDGAERLSCAYPASEKSCRAASCAAGVATLAAACDGAGACPLPQTVACAPNACSGEVCGGAGCSFDADCPAGAYCAAGTCQTKLGPGTPCSAAAQCASGHCVDSVCCDGVCGGQCEACNVAGQLGTCSPVLGAPRGARTPCADDGTACAGVCDGILTTACSYPDGTVECRAASCAAGLAVVPAACDGLGACPPLSVRVCDPLACAGVICSGGCANDGECAAGFFCSAGKCEPKKPAGGTCGKDAECVGGLCVDGFCCDRACDAQCEACDVTGSEGTCSPVTGIPHGGRAACAGQGACQGRCDGISAAACAFPGASTVCADPSCEAGVLREASTCNGAGECAPGTASSCTTGSCQGAACSCTGQADCTGGLVCLGGACVVEPPDAGLVPPDASVTPPDAAAEPPDAALAPADAAIEPPDAAVVEADATTIPPDATVVEPSDATVVIPPDASVVVLPDAQVVAPDAEAPGPDAEITQPDAEAPGPDAQLTPEDATVIVPADAAAPGLDASGLGLDAGVPDGALGAGWALTGGCACGAGTGTSPLALFGLAVAGLFLRRRRG